jgi:copper(I)-binding protein
MRTNNFFRVNRIIKMIILLVACCVPASNTVAHSSGDLVVQNAWINEAPPNAKVLAAYMVIENHTAKNDALISVTSGTFAKVETHQSIEEDGMAKMIKLPKINVPAQGKAVLAPGGMHLMLIKPKKRLKQGDHVELILNFEGGKKISVKTMVKKSIGHSTGQNGGHGKKTHQNKPHGGEHKH